MASPRFLLSFGGLLLLSALFSTLSLQNGAAAVDLDKMVFQLTYNVLLKASEGIIPTPIGSGEAPLPLKTRLKMALKFYQQKVIQEQEVNDFADAFFEAIMHLAVEQKPVEKHVNLLINAEVKSVEEQLGPKVQKVGEAKTVANKSLALSSPLLSPRTMGGAVSKHTKDTAAVGKKVLPAASTIIDWVNLQMVDDHFPEPVSPSQQKSPSTSSEKDAAEFPAAEDWEIVEPSFDMESLENFKKFYAKYNHARAIRGEPYDTVSHLQTFPGNGRHILRVMLLFYDLYTESVNFDQREKLLKDPKSTYWWLTKVTDRIQRIFGVFSEISRYPDILNNQVLNLFRPRPPAAAGMGSGSPRSPKSASSPRIGELRRSNSLQQVVRTADDESSSSPASGGGKPPTPYVAPPLRKQPSASGIKYPRSP